MSLTMKFKALNLDLIYVTRVLGALTHLLPLSTAISLHLPVPFVSPRQGCGTLIQELSPKPSQSPSSSPTEAGTRETVLLAPQPRIHHMGHRLDFSLSLSTGSEREVFCTGAPHVSGERG